MQQINFLNCDLAKLKAEINLNSAWNDPNIAPSIQNRIYKMGKFLGRHGDEKLYYGALEGVVYGFMETKNPNTYKWEKDPNYRPSGEEQEGNIDNPPTLEDVNNELVVYVMDGDTKVYYFATYDKVVSQYIGGDSIDIDAIYNSTDCFSTEEIILTNLIAEEDLGEFATDELANTALADFVDGLPTEDVMTGAVAKASYTVQGTYKVKYYKFNSTWGNGEGSDFKAIVPEIGDIFQNTADITGTTYTWSVPQETPTTADQTIDLDGEDFNDAEAAGQYMKDELEGVEGVEGKVVAFTNYTINSEPQDPYYFIYEVDDEGTKFYQYGTYSLSAIFEEHHEKDSKHWTPSSYVRTAPTSLVRCAVLPEDYTGELLGTYNPATMASDITFEEWLFEINRTRAWEPNKNGYYERIISASKSEYYVITTDGPIRPTDTITVEFRPSQELYSKYAEDAIVNIDGREYTIDILGGLDPMSMRPRWIPIEQNFYMNRDHRISIKWSGDIIETFTFIAIR